MGTNTVLYRLKRSLFLSVGCCLSIYGFSQSTVIEPGSSQILRHLCKNIGPRLSGSANAQKAVEFGYNQMKAYRFDTVFLQPVMVPHWERGPVEKVVANGKSLRVKALGGSVGTDDGTVQAEVIEVKSFTELEKLGAEKIKGKIVFFNRPMDPKYKDTFQAYSGAVDQRGEGAVRAARQGAVAVLVRSMTLRLDQFAHTGALRYLHNGFQKTCQQERCRSAWSCRAGNCPKP